MKMWCTLVGVLALAGCAARPATSQKLDAPAQVKELFSAKCVAALSGWERTWRVDESARGLVVRYTDLRRKYSARLRGPAADDLRAAISRLRLTPTDVEFLRSNMPVTDGHIWLRPFDGVTYHFMMPNREVVTIDNPSFDLEIHPGLDQAARLRQVLDLLERLQQRATQ